MFFIHYNNNCIVTRYYNIAIHQIGSVRIRPIRRRCDVNKQMNVFLRSVLTVLLRGEVGSFLYNLIGVHD